MKVWFSNEDLIKLNHLVASLTRAHQHTQSLKLFVHAHASLFLRPDHYTLSAAVTAAANARRAAFGAQLHGHAVRTGLRAHSHVANSLVSLYAKAGDLRSVKRAFAEISCPDAYSWTTLLSACAKLDHVGHALQLFEEIPKRHVAVWNAIITGCAENGHGDEAFAFDLFRDMHKMGVKADKYTFATMLSLCSLELLDYGRHVHSVVIKSGFLGWTSVVNSLITMYFKCGCVVDACEVFEEAEEGSTCDHVTYNAMIDGFVSVERSEDAFLMFRDMQNGGFGPTEVTFVSVMSSCSCLRAGCQAQAQAIKMGFVGCVAVNNAMMTMYSGFGVNEVRDIFEGMEERDVVSWNIMVSTFLQEDLEEEAILSYLKMRREGIEPDEFTYGSLLVASDSLQVVEMIHSLLCKSGFGKIEVLNALVSAYCRHGKIKRAFQIFSGVPYKNLISWNSIISGFLMNGCLLQGLEQFSALISTHVKPNAYSLSLVLTICSSMSAMSHGRQVHGFILRHGFSSEVSLGNALVTMYAKCGSLDRALRVFDAMMERDTISWNAIISAYAQHGQGEEAVCCFEAMQTTPGIKPDQATFTAVLSACSHAGLVDDGARIFYTMVKVYEFVPSVDHFSCIVDLLGRSGYLDEAERVIKGGYFGAHSNICWSLFSACAAHGNLSLGRTVARLLLERDHNNPSVYVLLSNICAAAGQWEEAAKLRDMMREFGTTKQRGCSWIRT
ncbi:pentatricopeptide repeat-containing protein At3g49740 [Cajanus cajan]|uniref:pentatricopeptide repeat-containing protein At3g49740 n=1 Tax=Cajanus cajan TaxID=3821 RepID=UPI00098DA26B|nr:pentatricopeptide repeat-containing protein At3g49740 [Cajanus cajan]